MQYLFEIATINSPVYKEVTPDVSNLTFEKKYASNTYTERIFTNGDVIFFGKDYDLIKSYSDDKINYRIYENGELLSTGYFYKRGEFDLTNGKFTAELIINDVFTDFEEKGKEKYNILEAETNSFDVIIQRPDIEIQENSIDFLFPAPINSYATHFFYENDIRTSAIVDFSVNGLPQNNSPWVLVEANYTIDPVRVYAPVGSPGFSDYQFSCNCKSTYVAEVGYGTIVNGVNVGPPYDRPQTDPLDVWIFQRMVTSGNVELPKYIRKYPTNGTEPTKDAVWHNSGFARATAPDGDKIIRYINNRTELNFTEGLKFNRSRTLKNVTKFLLNKINPLISLNADSFKYFDSFESENLTFENSTTNKCFENLSIGQLTDFIPNQDLTQKEFSARVGYLSFNDLVKFLHDNFSVSFKIENNIFYFVHFSEFSTNGINSDYQELNGVNYLRRSNQIEKDSAEFDSILNEQKGNSIDFLGGKLDFPTVGINVEVSYNSSIFFTDINDIFRTKSDSYNTESTNQFVLLALQEVGNKYYLRNATGLVSGDKKNNSELSFSFIAKNVLSDLPSNTAELNGSQITISNSRLTKLNTASFKFPIKVFSETDFSKNIDFFGKKSEFTSVKKKLGENIANAEIKY